MLVILTVEPKGLILCILKKGCLTLSSLILPFFQCPLLFPDQTYHVESLCTCSVWCVLLERFSFS
ncbi:unnamed protein product [Staurois parvus]|uniref:Uncharacterized protein n=1 Tax=Staurois parvus TaxID=386267 RepID=A0ABN9AHF7_9NEOB|nr:unnamed protein product [Staurois parvus]